MAENYRYVLDSAVVEHLLALPSQQRDQFVLIFRRLAQEPFQFGDFTFQDSSGRQIQKKFFSRWLLSYWADHAAKELKIIGIQNTKR